MVRKLDPGLTVVPALRREIEGRIVAAMEHPHPNLLTPLAYTAAARGFCIALPQTVGFSLLELLKQRSVLSPAEVLRLLEPLARASDCAVQYRLAGFDLSKESVMAHFPDGLTNADRQRVLAETLDHWPPYEIIGTAISLGDITGHSDASLASMATMRMAATSNVALSPIKALANLVCEMLGSDGRTGFAPIPRLSEKANGVLRRAYADENAFSNAAGFFDEFRTAVGKTGGSTVPGIRTAIASTMPRYPQRPPSLLKPKLIAALVLLLTAGLGAGYWFGIHEPRERDRQNRQAEADAEARDLAEKQQIAEAQQSQMQAEAEKTKAEAEKAKDLAKKQRLAIAEAERDKANLNPSTAGNLGTVPPSATVTPAAEQPASQNLAGSDTENPAEALYKKGLQYFLGGNGVMIQQAKGVELFQEAANQKVPEAEARMAFLRRIGYQGLEMDPSLAENLAEDAIKRGLIARAASLGGDSAVTLGDLYHYGIVGQEDDSKAVKQYTKAADQGFAEAQYDLGFCYSTAQGVPHDKAEAVKYYRAAADQGLAEAQSALAGCYQVGEGVQKDIGEAIEYYKKAANQGEPQANAVLPWILSKYQ